MHKRFNNLVPFADWNKMGFGTKFYAHDALPDANQQKSAMDLIFSAPSGVQLVGYWLPSTQQISHWNLATAF